MNDKPKKSLLEVQFPIGQLSLESYIERQPYVGKKLGSLGKWWGTKPLVMTRAIILGSLFESSDDPNRWADDLEIFLKLMCFDNAGMWSRKTKKLPATLCYAHASLAERHLFLGPESWAKKMSKEQVRQMGALEKRVFYALPHFEQRQYCCRVEQIEGPPPESWIEINNYCGTKSNCLHEWVAEMSNRKFGCVVRVGDAFSGSGSIPFEAAELGCDVYASDLNPVSCTLTWTALNVIGGSEEFHRKVVEIQKTLYDDLDAWYLSKGYESSPEGWRSEAHLYCVEIEVPEWDGWRIPVSGSWEIGPKQKIWVELVPNPINKSFEFRVGHGGAGYNDSLKGTKQGPDLVCPQELWEILQKSGKASNVTRSIPIILLRIKFSESQTTGNSP
jgi:hypothetical protein